MERFADFIVLWARWIAAVVLVVTVFFTWQARNLRIETLFSSLEPEGHPFIEVHHKYRDNYGSPLTVYLMVEVTAGDIYNLDTLEKIRRITDRLDAIPGVNHDQVISLTSRKAKYIAIKGNEIRVENLTPAELPRTETEMQAFRERVMSAGAVGTLVSADERAALLTANFLERRVDLGAVFTAVREIQQTEQDARHKIYLAGQPVLSGWVKTYQREVFVIMAASFVFVFVLLWLYIRSWALTLYPLIATVINAIWGVGFAGWLGYHLDPLILTIPMLLIARTMSHAIQKVERIIELEALGTYGSDAHGKAKALILALFGSGLLGIGTDALGILIIAVTTIPLMRELAIFCSFWSAMNVVSVLVLVPVLVALFGIPRGAAEIEGRLERSPLNRGLDTFGRLLEGRRPVIVGIGFMVVFLASVIASLGIRVGDLHPGTALLWQDSPYNEAIRRINAAFSGSDELYVIVEPEGDAPDIRHANVLGAMREFQRYAQSHPAVRRTFSYADFIVLLNRRLHGNHVKWEELPETDNEAMQLAFSLLRGTDPGDFKRYVDDERYHSANIILWLEDHRGDTLRSVVSWIAAYPSNGNGSGVKLRLASGLAGVLAAVNDEVGAKEKLIFWLATLIIGLACYVTFRSFAAMLLLLAPLVATNFIVMTVMIVLGIGLDINTLPIVSVGMGVGIDYGIYLLTRVVQEFRLSGDFKEASQRAIHTTGRAIFFTATIMVLSVILWYLFSSFRFQAEMGLLLALIMAINMVGALVVIPALIVWLRPQFALEVRLLAWD